MLKIASWDRIRLPALRLSCFSSHRMQCLQVCASSSLRQSTVPCTATQHISDAHTELWRTRVILYSDTNKPCPCYSRLSSLFFFLNTSVIWKGGLYYQTQSQILSTQRFKKCTRPPLRKDASQNIAGKQIPSWQQSRSHNPQSANTFPQLIVPPQEASPQPGVQVPKSSTFLHLL